MKAETTLKISKDIKEELEKLKIIKRESYEDIIVRLIKAYKGKIESLGWLLLAERSFSKIWDNKIDEAWNKV